MELRQFITENIRNLLNEALNVNSFKEFIASKPRKVTGTKIKGFLYHGTSVHPKEFNFTDDYDYEKGGNAYMSDVPPGVIFLTTDINEAKAYGQYVIPCEVKIGRYCVFEFNADNPSQIFDKDYDGITNFNMFGKFQDEGYEALQVKGYNKSTFITYSNLVVPRTDLAQEFYDRNKKIKS